MSRGTGETFRKICRALAEASEGKKVAYVSQFQNTSRHSFDMATGIVRSSLSLEIKAMTAERKIVFPSDGYLQFVLAEDIERKRRGMDLSEYNDD